MSSITHDELRIRILRLLSEYEKEEPSSWGMDRSTLQKALGVSRQDMDSNVMYLKRRGLIDIVEAANVIWFRAKITAVGGEFLRDKEV